MRKKYIIIIAAAAVCIATVCLLFLLPKTGKPQKGEATGEASGEITEGKPESEPESGSESEEQPADETEEPGVYEEDGVVMTEISPDSYPYRNSGVDIVDAINDATDFSTVGGFTAATVHDGRVRMPQTHEKSSCGVRLALPCASVGYTAAQLDIDNSENETPSWLGFSFSSPAGTAKPVSPAVVYLISREGTCYLYESPDGSSDVMIPAGFKGTVVLPFDRFAYGSGDMLDGDHVTGLTVLMRNVSKDPGRRIYLDNYSYIVGTLADHQITEFNCPYARNKAEPAAGSAGTPGVSILGGFAESAVTVLENRAAVKSAHSSPDAALRIDYGAASDRAAAIVLDIDASGTDREQYIGLMPATGEGYAELRSDAVFYLYCDEKYYRYSPAGNGSLMIPAGFAGSVILPVDQLVYQGTSRAVAAEALSGAFCIQYRDVVTDDSQTIRYGGVSYVNAEEVRHHTFELLPLGGGGYITGLVIHPLDPDIKYARTDVGGCYRWDPDNNRWIQLAWYHGADSKLYGTDGIAVDPSNKDVVYACLGDGGGTGTPGIYKSTDRGNTWTLLVYATFYGNGEFRQAGECIQVDPNNPEVIYAGTRGDGLYYTRDGGATWSVVPDIPGNYSYPNTPFGIRPVLIDPRETENGRSKVIYAGAHGIGLYRSADGGDTWSILPDAPKDIWQMDMASDGCMYFTTLNGVIRYDGVSFTDISPEVSKRVYNALDVDPTNPDRIIVCHNNTGPDDCMNMNIYLTEDGGKTWTQKNNSIRKLDKLGWWPDYYWSSATSTLCFNPDDTREVWLADWYGVWATCNINDETVDWYSKVRGHEEFVTFDMMTLPAGPVKLLVGSVDNGRLYYTDLTKNPPDRSGSDCRDLAYSYGNPNFVIQASSSPVLLISEDYGVTLRAVDASPAGNVNKAAISATDTNNIVVLGCGMVPYYTTDGGATWNASTGAETNPMTDKWARYDILEADGANGNIFYFSGTQGIYRSDDGGRTFALVNTKIKGWHSIVTACGTEGRIYLIDNGSLCVSDDYGETFTRITTATNVTEFTIGAGKSGEGLALYIRGNKGVVRGIYISDDYGKTWELVINDSKLAVYGQITGDMQVYGRCFLSSGGVGVIALYK